jgi:hypothetical protein
MLRLAGPLDAAAVLEFIDRHLDWEAVLAGADIVLTRRESREFHQPIALFTSAGLRSAIVDAGLHVEHMASANAIVPQFEPAAKLAASPGASDALRALELAVCDWPGLLDAGGHLLAVATRPAEGPSRS